VIGLILWHVRGILRSIHDVSEAVQGPRGGFRPDG
jgi:hypothetical protein